MERRELYDPEDIEQLLLERPFDELLDEERAFVLRHLSGRDEYERMRQLLLSVHHVERDDEVLEAEPVVRDRVMQVFKAQQRPQWRVWLNSVGGLLLPSEPRHYWRPALALASLAVLVTVGVNLYTGPMSEKSPLAELRKEEREKSVNDEFKSPLAAEKEKPAPPAEPPALSDTRFQPQDAQASKWMNESTASGATTNGLAAEQNANYTTAEGMAEEAPAPTAGVVTLKSDRSETDDEALERTAHAADKDATTGTYGYIRPSADSIQTDLAEVTRRDLYSNQSTTNVLPSSMAKVESASRKAKTETYRARAAGELAQEQEKETSAISADLMGLLHAAW